LILIWLKKKRKSKNKKSILFYINILFVIVLIILIALLANQFLTLQPISKQIENKPILQKKIDTKTEHEKFEEKTKALEIEYVDENYEIEEIKNIPKQKHKFKFIEKQPIVKQIVEKEIKKPKLQKPKPPKIIKKEKKPILALLIDDVTTSRQLKKIKNIGYPITMAFLPPTSLHKYSAKIAKQLDIYMIHLPLEARTKRYEETDTLHIIDTIDTIDKRIQYLKKIYPKAKYINNHTGSKFTSNKKAMDKLMQVLKKYNYIFVDSRTTGKTQAKIQAKKYNVKYLSRNIFLDNKQDKKYIQKQLKKAVLVAKRKGISIAIGHPHTITLKTLKESKHLLKDVKLVYINEL
jgi:polysaccharide deacetylase 2 family uncharacterized protein YibQ